MKMTNMDLTKYFKEPVYVEELRSDFIPGVEVTISDIRTSIDEKTNQMFYEQCASVNVDPDALIETGRLNMKLYKELEEAESHIPKWTKVEDGLPEPNTYVILYTDRGLTFVGALGKDNEWYEGNPTQSYGCHVFKEWLGKVTHWMPWPDRPVEER